MLIHNKYLMMNLRAALKGKGYEIGECDFFLPWSRNAGFNDILKSRQQQDLAQCLALVRPFYGFRQ